MPQKQVFNLDLDSNPEMINPKTNHNFYLEKDIP